MAIGMVYANKVSNFSFCRYWAEKNDFLVRFLCVNTRQILLEMAPFPEKKCAKIFSITCEFYPKLRAIFLYF
ncbi:hypothetical protein C7382_1077 [Porphyromonas loveana]|uniref:Uncharacterized protein n=1 Tax=Porphyromonas loveana TaxID=1884669 RepID=A0A2U1FEN9_9PORP|nr:hypothetical protein C7382_1077 [Porphyromonas loveana]